MQGLLAHLAPFPWDQRVSVGFERRQEQLLRLVERAARHGLKIYLYLNEPRSRSLVFFGEHPELKGVVQGDHAALCTSAPEVQRWLSGAIETICRAVPGLGGFFTITASENFTNCWSHHQGKHCVRCGGRGAAEVIADLLVTFQEGIRRAGGDQLLIAWDWGWADAWVQPLWNVCPARWRSSASANGRSTLSVAGFAHRLGNTVSPRWAEGHGHGGIGRPPGGAGCPCSRKSRWGNTWELAAVPFIPAVEQAWAQGRNLREEKISGLMLGWTLGGHPSPNLEAAVAGLEGRELEEVARRRHGARHAECALEAWRGYSRAFREFPFHVGCVYHAPWQMDPRICWSEPTGYASTMVGLPYDDVTRWRSIYPAKVWCAQLEKVADGFDATTARRPEPRPRKPAG